MLSNSDDESCTEMYLRCSTQEECCGNMRCLDFGKQISIFSRLLVKEIDEYPGCRSFLISFVIQVLIVGSVVLARIIRCLINQKKLSSLLSILLKTPVAVCTDKLVRIFWTVARPMFVLVSTLFILAFEEFKIFVN